MEANYFTILWWFLPYIDMNHPWVYLCPTILNKVFFFKYLFTWLHQVLVASGLSCPVAYGIFPDQRLNHVLCTGRRFLTTGSPRKSPSLISVLGPSEGLLRIPNCLFSSLSSSLDHKFLYWFSHSQNLAECNRVVKKKKGRQVTWPWIYKQPSGCWNRQFQGALGARRGSNHVFIRAVRKPQERQLDDVACPLISGPKENPMKNQRLS